jgi:hypothetical protein
VKPAWVNKLSIGLCITRFAFYLAFYTTDAQWQLNLIPLWIADLPITVIYWWLPVPIGEAFIGPVWWFFLPQLIWWAIYGRRMKKNNRMKEPGKEPKISK